MKITKEILSHTTSMDERWENGVDHDPRSEEIGRAIGDIDYLLGDFLGWKFGGDGDNGEFLLYELDMYFELKDKGLI